ncbi:MAG: FAD binding domain-containing protein [Defluviimonas sp.]|uniref:FAD binding domain-containing protein n=1 Tax=Albidovulum sp. TaxID=1872424 RepID=UPI001D9747E6|nr:FAD binding domain-containing protein [Paracoccaceae bacterium]MCC0063853.1 FAD binding domain-containing protein [Defluviimonas sp.]
MPYLQSRSLDEALAELSAAPLAVVAGGTDFFPAERMRQRSRAILDISRTEGLRGIARVPGGWRIGATSTWSEVARADLPPAFDGLRAAARQVGALQIQTSGTVGGNLCNASPAADGMPPLLTLEAEVELASAAGRRRLPLDRFVTGVRRTDLGPGELVVALHLPEPPEGAGAAFVKLGSRKYLVISIAMAAALVTLRGGRIATARIAVGACSPVARPLPALAGALVGLTPAEALALPADPERFMAGLRPIDDVRGSASYRLDVAHALCLRAVAEAARGAADA